MWWTETESNGRPHAYQACALPTELPVRGDPDGIRTRNYEVESLVAYPICPPDQDCGDADRGRTGTRRIDSPGLCLLSYGAEETTTETTSFCSHPLAGVPTVLPEIVARLSTVVGPKPAPP